MGVDKEASNLQVAKPTPDPFKTDKTLEKTESQKSKSKSRSIFVLTSISTFVHCNLIVDTSSSRSSCT